MKEQKAVFKIVNDSRGMLSAEFLFSLVLAAGLCIVLFSLTFSLSMAEVAQYIAFSSSRAHAAAHLDQDKQEQMAKDKYNELVNNKILKNLFNSADGGWFSLGKPEIAGGGPSGKFFDDYNNNNLDDRVPQTGVRFDYITKLLSVKIAFLGSTADDTTEGGFKAKVTALLIREPTQKECWNLQVKQRYSAILSLDPRYSRLDKGGNSLYQQAPMEDNGC
jgi:hypothetical protein